MVEITGAAVRAALAGVHAPGDERDLVAAGLVSGVVVRGGHVGFTLETDPQRAAAMEPVRRAAEEAVRRIPGVLSVSGVLTAHRPAPRPPGRPQAGTPKANPPQANPPKANPPKANPPKGGRPAGRGAPIPVPGAVVAVASGKGGVGKSTTAVNLALATAALGKRTGLLDADIYGPSVPALLGMADRKPHQSPDGQTILPLRRFDIAAMSIGFMVPADKPVIWRGPMVMGALERLLRDVAWGELDILFVDMPPGTGDTQLTMAQRVRLAGAVIVSTPQDIALADARKGLNMFRQVDVPVFGIVENMSYFNCPHCGGRTDIFGHGGARAEAARLGCDFLGALPLDADIRALSDAGTPIVAARPDSPHSVAWRAIAGAVLARLDAGDSPARRPDRPGAAPAAS